MHQLPKFQRLIALNMILFLGCVTIFTSCRSYETLPNSYIVRGEDNFESIEGKLSIFMGPYTGDQMWDGQKSHLTNEKPSSRYTKIFKRLGYGSKTYSVLFTDTHNTKFGLAALINNGVGKDQELIDLDKLQLKSKDGAKWYAQTKKIGADNIYHAVIPLYNKGIAQKYLSIIKILPAGEPIDTVEHFVQQNAKTYQDLGYTLSNLEIPNCPEGVDDVYYDYTVPQSIQDSPGYYLLKVYKNTADDKGLFFYTLLGDSPIKQGAFRACPGKYTMIFSTLQGDVLFNRSIELN